MLTFMNSEFDIIFSPNELIFYFSTLILLKFRLLWLMEKNNIFLLLLKNSHYTVSDVTIAYLL